MSTKFLIISDIHIGESRDSTTNPGIVRQANTQAKTSLINLMRRVPDISPDVIVHLGDALRDLYIPDKDQKNMLDAYTILESTNVPVIHLLGNHELRAFSRTELETFLQPVMKQKTFRGAMDLGTLQLMWLDLELNDEGLAVIPEQTSKWLEKNIDSAKPTILFSHYSLVPLNHDGNFYFGNTPQAMFFQNAEHVLAQLKAKNVTACISAHVHMFTHKVMDEVHFISNPAFSENIAAPEFPENNPAVYSVMEVDSNHFTYSSYSGDFCFAKVEGEVG